MQAKSFTIIAETFFAMHGFIKGAFNSHHRARLVAAGTAGKVTKEGAVFFSNRPRMAPEELKKAVEASGYKIVSVPGAGFDWAVNAQGAAWIAGQGKIGQSLFAYAISDLSQAAAKAATKIKPTSAIDAKAKAEAKQAAPKAETKPAETKAKATKPRATAKAKPAEQAQVQAKV